MSDPLTVGPVLGAKGRAEIWRWVRFRAGVSEHALTNGWGHMLLPWVLPPGVWVSIHAHGEVQA